jgi:hypothetical protein
MHIHRANLGGRLRGTERGAIERWLSQKEGVCGSKESDQENCRNSHPGDFAIHIRLGSFNTIDDTDGNLFCLLASVAYSDWALVGRASDLGRIALSGSRGVSYTWLCLEPGYAALARTFSWTLKSSSTNTLEGYEYDH